MYIFVRRQLRDKGQGTSVVMSVSICLCFSGTVPKPAGSLARSSSLCRSRRSVVPSSPQSQRAQLPPHAPLVAHPRHPHHPQHPQHSLPSPDPDILSVSSCPALYRNEEEEEAIYFTAEKQWYWLLVLQGMGLSGHVSGSSAAVYSVVTQAFTDSVASHDTYLWTLKFCTSEVQV